MSDVESINIGGLDFQVQSEEELIAQKDTMLMIANPTHFGPPAVPSDTALCNFCGQDVWISHLSSTPLVEKGMRIQCLECLVQQIAPDNPELAEELAKVGKKKPNG